MLYFYIDSFLSLIFFMQPLFFVCICFWVCFVTFVCFFFLHTLFSLPFYDFNKNYHFYLLFLVSTAILLVSILIVFKEKKIKKENLM